MRTQQREHTQAYSTPSALDTLDAIEGLLAVAATVVPATQAAGTPVRFLGLTSLDDEPRGYPGTETDWIVLPAAQDPLVAGGSLPMPAHARRDLRACLAIIDFPVILIAHEVAKGAVSIDSVAFHASHLADDPVARGQQLRAALPATAPATATARRICEIADRTTEAGGVILAGAVLAGAIAAGGIATGGLALAAVLLADGLDPILVGAVPWQGKTDPGTPVALFEITRWTW